LHCLKAHAPLNSQQQWIGKKWQNFVSLGLGFQANLIIVVLGKILFYPLFSAISYYNFYFLKQSCGCYGYVCGYKCWVFQQNPA